LVIKERLLAEESYMVSEFFGQLEDENEIISLGKYFLLSVVHERA
jgi:hypothetical protein